MALPEEIVVSSPVIVVGTTPDYIAKIHKRYPESTVFLADTCHQGSTLLHTVDPAALLFVSLDNAEEALRAMDSFLGCHGLSPRGVACFDCESLQLASRVAAHFGLPFPSHDAIARCRNKFESRSHWRKEGIPSPAASLVSGPQETLAFFHEARGHIVLKPVSGSGSELLFYCRTPQEVLEAVRTMERELPRRRANALFRPIATQDGETLDPCRVWIAEEYVPGPEFSCDFVLRNEDVVILRTTAKVKHTNQPFGSVQAYLFPAVFPRPFSLEGLCSQLERASSALGFTWGHFMVDFIIHDGHAVIIEMTPRPGGDSIPDLVETATGCDLLGMHLDIVSGSMPEGSFPLQSRTFASINLYAPETGIIDTLDSSPILSLPWVERVIFRKSVGDRVVLPPEDYDNRLLGYCIARLETNRSIESMCRCVEDLLCVSVTSEPSRLPDCSALPCAIAG